MRKAVLTAALVAGLLGAVNRSWAAGSDTITVTVSLQEVISVTVTPNSWNLGAISLGSTNGPANFTATNDGNTTETFDIAASNALGGWVIGTPPGADQFEVAVTAPAITLTTVFQQLAPAVGVGVGQLFALTYRAPTSDSKGGGVSQNFTITVKASKAP